MPARAALTGASSVEDSAAVSELVEIVLDSPAPMAWIDVTSTLLGAGAEAVAVGTDTVSVELARSKSVTFRSAPRAGVNRIRWVAGSPRAFKRIVEQASAAHDAGQIDRLRLHADRLVPSLLLTDPDGVRVEISGGSSSDTPPSGCELGHVVLGTEDLDASLAFYGGVLGLAVSDEVRIPQPSGPTTRGVFLRAGDGRHHSLALIKTRVGLRHVMVELPGPDDVGRAYDRATDARMVSRTIGRHTNDRMFSFYAGGPDGYEIEIGSGGIVVDDADWDVTTHDAPSVWGHRFVRRDAEGGSA
jgi:3,4-dihydroxy-9,10-secoandrosta-1,3,5(10)-triene-9,17-dione 4,5-dioxygenase